LHLSLGQIIAVLGLNNRDFAAGFITNDKSRFLLKASLKRDSINALKSLNITPNIVLEDVADITISHFENSAQYYGNTKKAIALSIQRTQNSDLKNTYQNISFEVSDTQAETIMQSTENMFESLRDAIIMSTIVVFFFLASFRQVLVVHTSRNHHAKH